MMNRKYKIVYLDKMGKESVIMIFSATKRKAKKWFKEVHPREKILSIERIEY